MPFFIFKHNLVDFLGRFFRMKFDHQDGAYISSKPTYPRCNHRVTRGRVAICIEQLINNIHRIFILHWEKSYHGPALNSLHSDGMTLACLLQFPGYMWNTRDLNLYFNIHEKYPLSWFYMVYWTVLFYMGC